MSFAIGFVRFRKVQVKGDTIPKPVGLGFRLLPRELRIKHLSSKYRVSVKYLSRRPRASNYNAEGTF
jgi:hypothetical protein